MGTKKERIYGQGAPFKGVPQRFGGAVALTALPESATGLGSERSCTKRLQGSVEFIARDSGNNSGCVS